VLNTLYSCSHRINTFQQRLYRPLHFTILERFIPHNSTVYSASISDIFRYRFFSYSYRLVSGTLSMFPYFSSMLITLHFWSHKYISLSALRFCPTHRVYSVEYIRVYFCSSSVFCRLRVQLLKYILLIASSSSRISVLPPFQSIRPFPIYLYRLDPCISEHIFIQTTSSNLVNSIFYSLLNASTSECNCVVCVHLWV